MQTVTRTLAIVAMLAVSVLVVLAQTTPLGHWEGTVHAPGMEVQVELDFTKNDKGALAGTFSQPQQGVRGLPISTISMDGLTLRFIVKAGAEASAFEAALSADGKSMGGEVTLGGMSAPFTLSRTGEARIPPAPKTGRIDKALEGVWKGAMTTPAGEMQVVLTVATLADGTATGTIASPNGSGIEIAIGVTQTASDVIVDVPSVSASFAGAVDATGAILAGTWTQGSSALPLTLRRNK